MAASTFAFALAFLLVFLIYRIARMLQNGRGLAIPGKVAVVYSYFLPDNVPIHFLLPRIPFIHEVTHHKPHYDGQVVFDKAGCDTVALVSPTTVYYITRDLMANREASITKRSQIRKTIEHYKLLEFFGRNVLTTEGKEWLRHRTVIQPAFSDANLRLVADATAEFTNEKINEWISKDVKEVDIDPELIAVTMRVICKAGFGINSVVFGERDAYDSKGKMSLSLALDVVSEEILTKLIVPDFLLRLAPTKYLKRVRDGFNTFQEFLYEIIKARREGVTSESKDLLNLLLDANESDAQHHLTDEEIVANTYMFLLAGHETTAHTLLWSFNLLAFHPEIQEKGHQEAMDVLGRDRDPNYDDYKNLVYCEAIMKEALRLNNAVNVVPKTVMEDTEITGIPVKAGTSFDLYNYGLSRNVKYWTNPDAFDPSRFDERVSKPIDPNLFVPFSRGPRGCIGFRFALIEGTLILAMLLRRFKFTHKQGASMEKMLRSSQSITTKPDEKILLNMERRW